MAAYRITINLKGKTVKGIRELEQEDVDTAWQIFYAAAVEVYSAPKILNFELVKISTFSDDYGQWKLSQEKLPLPLKKAYNRKDGRSVRIVTMGERAKLINRRMKEEDSIYILLKSLL